MRVRLAPFVKPIITKKYLKWVNDKEIIKFTSLKKKISKKNLQDYVIYCKNDENTDLFKILYFGTHIGNLRITKLFKNNGTIGIIIGEKKYHNKGIGFKSIEKATEISKKKGFKDLFIFLNKKNLSSLKIFQKNGYNIQKKIPKEIKLKKTDYLLKKKLN